MTIAVLANDTAAAHWNVTTVTQPGHGSAAINANGTITYTPDADYNGDDSFVCTLSAGTYRA